MTVRELIERLSSFPQDALVVIEESEYSTLQYPCAMPLGDARAGYYVAITTESALPLDSHFYENPNDATGLAPAVLLSNR